VINFTSKQEKKHYDYYVDLLKDKGETPLNFEDWRDRFLERLTAVLELGEKK